MRVILSQLLGTDWQITTLDEFPGFPEPEESGETYAENAKIKAEAARDATGELCIADDAGLEIDALGGAPGVKSKRFAGENTSFEEKIARVLELMKDVQDDRRTARFRCAVALAKPGGKTKMFESVRHGRIRRTPSGSAGFGYDPIFEIPEAGKTFAEMDPDEKNAVSHRGIVLREVAAFLRNASIG